MTNSKKNKKSIKIFNQLLNDFQKTEFLLKEFNIQPASLQKYIQMYRNAGFEVEFQKNGYEIKKYFDVFGLNEKMISSCAYLYCISKLYLSKNKTKKIINFLKKCFCLSNQKNYEKFNSLKEKYMYALSSYKYLDKIEILEEYIKNSTPIDIFLARSSQKNIIPLRISFENDFYLYYINSLTDKYNSISLKDINKITKNEKIIFNIQSENIIFELTGRMKDAYILREEEFIIKHNKESIIISNKEKDKQNLYKRLLKYDNLCKILFPKSKVKEFKEIIKKSLDNINNIDDNSYEEYFEKS